MLRFAQRGLTGCVVPSPSLSKPKVLLRAGSYRLSYLFQVFIGGRVTLSRLTHFDTPTIVVYKADNHLQVPCNRLHAVTATEQTLKTKGSLQTILGQSLSLPHPAGLSAEAWPGSWNTPSGPFSHCSALSRLT